MFALLALVDVMSSFVYKRWSTCATLFSLRMNLVALTDYSNQLVESLCDNLSNDVYKWAAFPNIIMDCYAQFLATMQVSLIFFKQLVILDAEGESEASLASLICIETAECKHTPSMITFDKDSRPYSLLTHSCDFNGWLIQQLPRCHELKLFCTPWSNPTL